MRISMRVLDMRAILTQILDLAGQHQSVAHDSAVGVAAREEAWLRRSQRGGGGRKGLGAVVT